MKKISLFFSALALVATTFSCQKVDIDSNAKISSNPLKVKAYIDGKIETRMSYTADNTANTITPAWQDGDAIIGFDNTGAKFTFTVSKAESASEAELDITGYTPSQNATTVYAIYYPGKTINNFTADGDLWKLPVDLASQGGVLSTNLPAIMCATGTIENNEVELHFTNQTAIIGVKKFQLNGVSAATTVTGLTLNGVITTGTFEVVGGNLVLTPGNKASHINATGSWNTDASGICETGVYFAAMPTTDANLMLNATVGTTTYVNVSNIPQSTIEAGSYYYMSKKFNGAVADVDGIAYPSIDTAWTVANAATAPCTVTLLDDCTTSQRLALNTTSGGSGAVTFDLNGKTLSMSEQIRVTGRSLTITDNSSDLLTEQGVISSSYTDGRSLYINSDGILNYQGGTLTHSASDKEALYNTGGTVVISGGKILSTNYRGVWSNGNLTINGNAIIESYDNAVYNNGGTAIIEGSAILSASLNVANAYGLRSYGSGATTILRGSASVSGLNALYCQNGSTTNISGNPTVYSEGGATVYLLAATVDISGGDFRRGGNGNGYVIYTDSGSAVVNISGGWFDNFSATNISSIITTTSSGGTVTVTGGYFNSYGINPASYYSPGKVYVTGGCFNKPIQPAYAKDASDNEYVNVLNTDPSTSGTYPFTLSPASSTPNVATVTQGSSNSWKNGTIECAMKAADVRAKANGDSNISMESDCNSSSAMAVSSGNSYEVILDLNGHALNSSASPAITSASGFTLKDSGSAGELSTSGAAALEVTDGTATVNSGSIVAATNAASVTGGTLNITGGYLYGGTASDIVCSSGTVAISGGWLRNEPSAGFAASGYAFVSGSETFNERTYLWTAEVAEAAATVNGEEYGTLALALAALNSYNGPDATATLQLQKNIEHNEAISLSNAAGKPVIFDLNGHVLSTNAANFINPTLGTLTITDSAVTKGKITSSSYQVLYFAGSSKCTVSDCVIECTQAAASSWNAQTAVLFGGSTMETTIENAWIYTTGYTSTIRMNNQGCKVTINGDSEISAGVGNEKGLFAIINNAGTLTINGGSIWTKSSTTETNAPSAVHNSNPATTNINGGYFYAGQDRTISGNNDVFNINGGFFDKLPSNPNNVIFESGKGLVSTSTTHNHATTGETLSYLYTVGSGFSEASTTEELASAVTNANAFFGNYLIRLTNNISYTDKIIFNHGFETVLDVNGYELNTTTADFITSKGKLIVTDNSAGNTGKILSTKTRIIHVTGSNKGPIYIEKVLLKSTCPVTSTDINSAPNYVVSLWSGSSSGYGTIYIQNGARIDALSANEANLRGVYCGYGDLYIDNAEIACYNRSALTAYTNANVTITGNQTSIYTQKNQQAVVISGVPRSNFSISGGYFYSSVAHAIEVRVNVDSKCSITGGYFSHNPNNGTYNSNSYLTGVNITALSGNDIKKFTPSLVGTELSYGYVFTGYSVP